MKRTISGLRLAFVALASTVSAVLVAPQQASADVPQIVVGMPFTSKWAYNVNVNPPYTDANSSHPSVHHTPGRGDWATDLYGSQGQPVRLHVPYANGSLGFSRANSSTSCGQSIRINVLVNGAAVGWLYFAHLNNVPGDPIINGMTIGTVHDWGACNAGRHVHVEFRSTSNYSCYADPGTTVGEGTALGVLGSANTGPTASVHWHSGSPPPATAPAEQSQTVAVASTGGHVVFGRGTGGDLVHI